VYRYKNKDQFLKTERSLTFRGIERRLFFWERHREYELLPANSYLTDKIHVPADLCRESLLDSTVHGLLASHSVTIASEYMST
jgi:hypothetical protein